MSSGGHVVIAGHCTVDDIHQSDGLFLPGTPGGAAAYATLGAIMYGARVTLITLTGDDYPFERFQASLSPHGTVDISHVRRLAQRSIHNVAWYRADGSRTFEIESWEAMEALTPTAADIPVEAIQDAIVLLTPASLPKQLELTCLLQWHNRPAITDTELHYFPTAPLKAALREVIARSAYFLPSIEHLQLLQECAARDVYAFLPLLAELGCPWIVVKEGAAGSTLLDCRRRLAWHISAIEGVAVKDTTGAGDGFSGGFAAALSDRKSPLEAACWGTVTASFVVESIGAVMPAHFDRGLAGERYRRLRSRVEETSRQW